VYHAGVMTMATIAAWKSVAGIGLGALALLGFASMAIARTLAVWRTASFQEKENRRLAGLCPKCGYDLRGTPDRCPECGAMPQNRRASDPLV
jgi:hypothetical protein